MSSSLQPDAPAGNAPEALAARARELEAAGDMEEAIELYGRVLELQYAPPAHTSLCACLATHPRHTPAG